MGLARIKNNFDLNNVFITHYEVPQSLIKTIDEFYQSQNVPNYTVENIPSWQWARSQKNNFDYYLLNHFPEANKDNCFLESPDFIDFVYQKIHNVKNSIIIQVGAGRENKKRYLDINQIQELIKQYPNYHYFLVGWANEVNYVNLKGNITNYINKTTMNKFLNLLGSCKIFIGPTGFGMIFSSFLGKKVFFTHNLEPKYINNAWDATEINSLTEIKL